MIVDDNGPNPEVKNDAKEKCWLLFTGVFHKDCAAE